MTDITRRIKFSDFEIRKLPDGHCESRVVLRWESGEEYEGLARGMDSQTGLLRCAADAAINALVKAVDDELSFELLGVKSIKAFDAMVVVVSLGCERNGKAQRLVGSCIIEANPPRGAALAVLNATNRLVANLIATR